MNIFPMNKEAANKRHWIVRWLRIIAMFTTISCIISGASLGYMYSGVIIKTALDQFALVVCVIVAGLLGFAVGILLSLPCWGLSLLLDDIHALRTYAEGFVVIGNNNKME